MKRSAFHILFFISFAAVVIFGSCGGQEAEYRRALLQAEALRDSLPDSALAIVQSIHADSIKTDHLRALHTLVTTEAKYKLYIEEPADSLLESAVEEFRAANDRPRLMRALFQLCLIPLERGEYSRSLALCLESMEIAESLNDKEYIAHTNDVAGIIQATIYNFRESMQMELKAAALFKELGKKRSELFSTINYAKNLYNIGRSSEAIAMMDSLIPTIDPADSGMIIYAAQTKVRPCILIGDIAGAKSADSIVCRYCGPNHPVDPLWSIIVAINNRELVKARKMIDEVSPTLSEMDRLHLETLFYSAIGDTSRCAVYTAKLKSEEMDSLFRIMRNGINLNATETDLYKYRIQESDKRSKTDRFIFLSAICTLSIIVVASLLYFLKWKRKSKKLHDALLSQMIKEQKEIAEANAVSRQTIFGKQFAILNMLCKDYYEKKDASEEVRATILKDVERLICSLGSPAYFKELEMSLNETHDGIVTKLYQTLPDLKMSDKKILVYTIAGISTKATCAICNFKQISQFYNRRQVLKNKIQKSDSEYKDVLLRYLS